MSDTKPKRPARTSATSAVSPGEAIATEGAPIIAPEPPAAEPVSVAREAPAPAAVAASVEQAEDAWTAIAEAHAVLARGFELAAIEMTGMTRMGMAVTADAAIALLDARTFAEAVEINAGLARRGVDTLLEGSAKLSEIGVKVVTEASRPILSRLGGAWSGVAPG